MPDLSYLLLFIFGASIGSFLNVVSSRYDPGHGIFKNVHGRSHCDYCQKKLGPLELIPIISFLIQLGKCRNCGRKLSFQYPIIEFLSGATFVLIPFAFLSTGAQILGKGIYPQFLFAPRPVSGGYEEALLMTGVWILIFLTLILISLIDLRLRIIPDSLNLFLLGLGIFINFLRSGFLDSGFLGTSDYGSFLGSYSGLLRFTDDVLINGLTGLVLGGFFFAMLYFITKGAGIGFGDVKLAFPLGLILGFPDIILATILSFIIGSIYGLALIIKKKAKMKSAVPFAPFMGIGVTLVFFFGYHIINAYFGIFSL